MPPSRPSLRNTLHPPTSTPGGCLPAPGWECDSYLHTMAMPVLWREEAFSSAVVRSLPNTHHSRSLWLKLSYLGLHILPGLLVDQPTSRSACMPT